MSTVLLVDETWEGETLCSECGWELEPGEEWSERLIAITPDNEFLVKVVCVPCATGVAW